MSIEFAANLFRQVDQIFTSNWSNESAAKIFVDRLPSQFRKLLPSSQGREVGGWLGQ